MTARPTPRIRYRVYVIELDPAVRTLRRFRERNPDARADKPCVYVGSTGHDPQVRFAQHKAGIRSNRYARRFGLRLRLRSMQALPSYATSELARKAEQRHAERLRRRGYAVWSN